MTTDIRPGIDLGPDFPLRRNQPKIPENNYENNDLFRIKVLPDIVILGHFLPNQIFPPKKALPLLITKSPLTT